MFIFSCRISFETIWRLAIQLPNFEQTVYSELFNLSRLCRIEWLVVELYFQLLKT